MLGTHVAGIIGAYYADQPELNGVAPGTEKLIKLLGSRDHFKGVKLSV
jgi:hypothetical protein